MTDATNGLAVNGLHLAVVEKMGLDGSHFGHFVRSGAVAVALDALGVVIAHDVAFVDIQTPRQTHMQYDSKEDV